MSPIDPFYTPDHVADTLLSAVRKPPTVVADFAAGHGALLRAAKEKWASASLVATDVSPQNVRYIRQWLPDTDAGRCDFLSPVSRLKCDVLKRVRGRITLAALNPPFTCRGASTVLADVRGTIVRCSTAMAFVINAIDEIAENGEIVAVLPAGSIYSEKDHDAWRLVKNIATVNVLGWNGHRTFSDCFPTTVMVHLRRSRNGEAALPQKRECSIGKKDADVLVYRGKIPMFTVDEFKSETRRPLIHSTELRGNRVDYRARTISGSAEAICGPAVLLARVGAPNASKIAILAPRKVVLSDCVIALCVPSMAVAKKLSGIIIEKWTEIEQFYTGTGARYITLGRLTGWLRQKGYAPKAHPSASHQAVKAIKRGLSV